MSSVTPADAVGSWGDGRNRGHSADGLDEIMLDLGRQREEIAIQEKIPYQFRQPGGGGTDAGAIQGVRAGVPVVSVSVPHRYTHSPISIARVDDWKNTVNLLHSALKRITPALLR